MKNGLVIGATILVIGGFIALFAFVPKESGLPNYSSAIPEDELPESGDPNDLPENVIARNTCVNHGNMISMHIHPVLSIFVDGRKQHIPANIGVNAECMRAVHTHDTTGELHVEFPRDFEFVLADFFANWGETFNSQQILDHTVSDTHEIVMTVNGEVTDAYENLVLEDLDQIEIRYQEKETEESSEEENEA